MSSILQRSWCFPARHAVSFAFAGMVALTALSVVARPVQVTVLATTDMHGTLRAIHGRYVDHNEGSLLQAATLIRKVREETPNTVLVDCGDIFQGTAESLLSTGRVMAVAMNALEYDAFAIGNHEFDWGVETLGKWLPLMESAPLAANLLVGEKAPEGFQRVRPFILKEMDGIRVGIVGLTTPNLPFWFRDMAEYDLHTLDSLRALERTLPELRALNPDVLVLLAHQGVLAKDDDANEINTIGRRFGEFDLVLGGHLHWLLLGARIGRVDYAQADSGASGVLRVDLTYDTVERRVTDKRFDWLPVTPDVPEAEDIAEAVSNGLARADAWMATPLGRLERELTYSSAVPGLCPVQQLLCRAIAERTGAEVVIHGVLSDRSLPAGPVSVGDVWKIVPYENTIGCAMLTPADLLAILEEGAEFLGTERSIAAWGVRYEVYPNATPGKRIRNLRAADGSPIHGRRRLKTAFNSYHLSGGGGRFPGLVQRVNVPQARLKMEGESARNMVIEYIRAHKVLDIPEGTNATVIRKERPRWQRPPRRTLK